MVEQLTFNQLAAGSNPAGLTKSSDSDRRSPLIGSATRFESIRAPRREPAIGSERLASLSLFRSFAAAVAERALAHESEDSGYRREN